MATRGKKRGAPLRQEGCSICFRLPSPPFFLFVKRQRKKRKSIFIKAIVAANGEEKKIAGVHIPVGPSLPRRFHVAPASATSSRVCLSCGHPPSSARVSTST